MEKVTYEKEITALLVIDPYNDFISEGSKIWNRLKTTTPATAAIATSKEAIGEQRSRKVA